MRFHESTPKILFSKHQNKAEFKNLDDSESSVVISQALKPCSLFDLIGLNNLNGLTDLNSPISSKNFLILMAGSSLAPK
jgi:hypothetical protein